MGGGEFARSFVVVASGDKKGASCSFSSWRGEAESEDDPNLNSTRLRIGILFCLLLLTFFFFSAVLAKNEMTNRKENLYDDSAHNIKKISRDPYEALQLDDASRLGATVLRYKLKLDDDFLRNVYKSIFESRLAGKRVGDTWIPKAAKMIPKFVSDDSWVTSDDLTPLNSICTKWCTRLYFPDVYYRVTMIANVIRLYDRLQEVTGLKFRIIFKGGVMIRLVLYEFLNYLSVAGRERALEFLDAHKALSLSDFDFEIVPNSHNPKGSLVHRYFLLDYAVLLWLQNAMDKEVKSGRSRLLHLDWSANERLQELKKSLQAEIDQLPSSAKLHGAKVHRVVLGDTDPSPPKEFRTASGQSHASPRKNVFIFDCEDTKCVLSANDVFHELGVDMRNVFKQRSDQFYATLNSYIGDEDSSHLARKSHRPGVFHLARIKQAFVFYYTTRDGEKCCERLGGEMIDLGQSAGEKDRLRHGLYAAVKGEAYCDYALTGMVIRSYTMEAFYVDHVGMIYHTKKEAWQAEKMEKRIVRYTTFFVAHIFSVQVKGDPELKLNLLKLLVAYLISRERGEAVRWKPSTHVEAVDTFVRYIQTYWEGAPASKRKSVFRLIRGTLSVLIDGMRPPKELYLEISEADSLSSELLF